MVLLTTLPAQLTVYVVSSIISPNSLVHFTGIVTVNKATCTEILRRLTDAIKRKRPEKWRSNGWFPLHDNAPAHRSVLVNNFLAKKNVPTLKLPHSPGLPPADFHPFPRIKSALKGRCFCDSTDIKNATDELKRLSQNSSINVSKEGNVA